MPTYTDVTNLPSTPASLSDADTHLSLTTPGINAQHYEWQGNSAGFWNPVNDDNGGTATATFLTQRTQKFSYDVAIEGGATGDKTLRGGTIPRGAILSGGVIVISTDVTGVTSSVGTLTLEVAGDLSSTVAGALPFPSGSAYVTGGSSGTPSNVYDFGIVLAIAGASPTIVTTADRSVVFSITVAAVLTGVFDIYITYMVPA